MKETFILSTKDFPCGYHYLLGQKMKSEYNIGGNNRETNICNAFNDVDGKIKSV